MPEEIDYEEIAHLELEEQFDILLGDEPADEDDDDEEAGGAPVIIFASDVKPIFPFGNLGTTSCALETYPIELPQCFARHIQGDWGDLSPGDKRRNQAALKDGSRIFSAYNMPDEGKVYIITEADRSRTTAMLASEY